MQGYDPSLPKTLLPVAGRPFAHWQLTWLSSQGVDSVVYSIGHLGHLVREYVGSGGAWGLQVTYVEEKEQLLGTGGALRLAADREVLDEHFFVLYGDSYLRVDLHALDAMFCASKLPAVMTVFANNGAWDTSNVVFDGSLVLDYRKGLAHPPPEMRYIDYGLTELSLQAVVTHIRSSERSDLSELLGLLSRERELGGYEVFQRFFEIGSPHGIQELDQFLSRQS